MNHRLVLALVFALLAVATNAQDLRKEKFNLGSWEDDIGYVQAVRIGNTLHVSGSVGAGDMPAALKHALDTVQQTLAHYRLDFRHVVKETIYTTDIEALKAAKEIRKAYYGTDFPAATWVQVARLYDPAHVVEVEVTAIVADK
jgi:enamine deaminase RidA (YjgF/YER057c/UK114 family)